MAANDYSEADQFGRWGDMDKTQQANWFRYMKQEWGPDLMGHYAVICYPHGRVYGPLEAELQEPVVLSTESVSNSGGCETANQIPS